MCFEKMDELLKKYQALCDYCDRFFESVVKAYPKEIHCQKGCSECCTLNSVAPLEAYVIGRQLSGIPRISSVCQGQYCRFLIEDACAVYPARPIICRTHGIPLDYPDREGVDVCPLNFRDREWFTIKPESILKAERITENFMRLNMAYCMIAGLPPTNKDRVAIWDIEPAPSD
ncbi:hypothetical protein K8S19_06400 [bacterium]|nr:hypothetical protein [bacterium]